MENWKQKLFHTSQYILLDFYLIRLRPHLHLVGHLRINTKLITFGVF
jgi:hypothetical protein